MKCPFFRKLLRKVITATLALSPLASQTWLFSTSQTLRKAKCYESVSVYQNIAKGLAR